MREREPLVSPHLRVQDLGLTTNNAKPRSAVVSALRQPAVIDLAAESRASGHRVSAPPVSARSEPGSGGGIGDRSSHESD